MQIKSNEVAWRGPGRHQFDTNGLALVSATTIVTMLFEERSRWAAWFLATSLAVTSLAAGYFLWRLL